MKKKTITLTLEYEPDPESLAVTVDEIRRDLESEISCCSYHYEVRNVTMEEAE